MTDIKRVIALGFFDGLHIGHSALMERVLKISEGRGLLPSVITFDRHPMSVVTGRPVPLINSCEDRAGLIHRIFGIQNVIILHFDKELMHMSWMEFVERLSTEWNAAYLVAGHDFRFGHKGSGNAERLMEKSCELGIECDIIPEVKYKGITSSSTYIRKLISEGDMEQANEFLGHPHVLTDIVHYGYRLGRTLGTPTINMCFQEGVLIPAYGVYATRVCLNDGSEHIGVTNIGVRPTVNHTENVTAETHILEFTGNLYGKMVRIEFYKRLRPEIKFSSIDELREQIRKDAEASYAYFHSV
ncbi:MAG: bifunctional riboflavin kinase/FAD synthetase [Clostridiales bacterium]|nr:bifunctional riboflavin kinase/FAD synthetase [Clostridiales bacterium]